MEQCIFVPTFLLINPFIVPTDPVVLNWTSKMYYRWVDRVTRATAHFATPPRLCIKKMEEDRKLNYVSNSIN